MKFILAYTICSAITGFCNTPTVYEKQYNSWTECVKAGAVATIQVTNKLEEKFNKEKLYISFFCSGGYKIMAKKSALQKIDDHEKLCRIMQIF